MEGAQHALQKHIQTSFAYFEAGLDYVNCFLCLVTLFRCLKTRYLVSISLTETFAVFVQRNLTRASSQAATNTRHGLSHLYN
jgi:hypothetical protein